MQCSGKNYWRSFSLVEGVGCSLAIEGAGGTQDEDSSSPGRSKYSEFGAGGKGNPVCNRAESEGRRSRNFTAKIYSYKFTQRKKRGRIKRKVGSWESVKIPAATKGSESCQKRVFLESSYLT